MVGRRAIGEPVYDGPIFACVRRLGAAIVSCMTPRSKIDLEKILASLNTICTECRYSIPPNEIMRIDFDTIKCPKCGAVFAPKKKS